ncbi:MAG: hypothetical protein LBQ73_11255 [Tannerellaceae bacterium]|nr:hypothetical protein [Tannerellaceae bacterium]
MFSHTKLISYNGIKAESLAAIAQGNALCMACTRFSCPEGARAFVRTWLLPLQGEEQMPVYYTGRCPVLMPEGFQPSFRYSLLISYD